jgi:hypothetical protein
METNNIQQLIKMIQDVSSLKGSSGVSDNCLFLLGSEVCMGPHREDPGLPHQTSAEAANLRRAAFSEMTLPLDHAGIRNIQKIIEIYLNVNKQTLLNILKLSTSNASSHLQSLGM